LAACYVAALEESAVQEGVDLGGAFRRTRKAAQNLGDFLSRAYSLGWEKALATHGLEGGEDLPPEGAAAFLAASLWGSSSDSLEAAVARVALARILAEILAAPAFLGPDAPARVVRRFLAAAFGLRLVLDLGESMEAAAPDASLLRQRLEALGQWLEQTAARVSPGPPPPGSRWLSLDGWTWLSRALEDLMAEVRGRGAVVEDGPERFNLPVSEP
jgi:hypothetical protein